MENKDMKYPYFIHILSIKCEICEKGNELSEVFNSIFRKNGGKLFKIHLQYGFIHIGL